MTIAELPKGTNLGGLLIKIPKSHQIPELNPYGLTQGYWKSQWGYNDGTVGIWFTKKPGESQIYPVFLDKFTDCINWEVI